MAMAKAIWDINLFVVDLFLVSFVFFSVYPCTFYLGDEIELEDFDGSKYAKSNYFETFLIRVLGAGWTRISDERCSST
jgi:hypothetical protein